MPRRSRRLSRPALTPSVWRARSQRSTAPIVAPFGYKVHQFVFHAPTKQIHHWSSPACDLASAVTAAMNLDAPSASPGNHRRQHSVVKIKLAFPLIRSTKVVINLTPEDHVHGVTKAFVICILVPLTHVGACPEPALKTSAFQFCQRVIDFADVNVNVPAVLLRDASTGFPFSVLLFLHPRDISLVFSTSNLSVKLPFNVHDTQVLPAFMERGRNGYFQTQVMEGYS
ncbi:hypothetical protein EJB05_27325 [Eragrostis curvula]|uniref:Uncharacterized protein n=1 Tax=Eragrostis curvula TaxID=38414 RepID=A0A5J9UM87_9POAL|nr:hypothetical protein EJB05_27325 [Eragrostis curvula]